MAEFCLDCWNKLNDTQLKPEDVTLSEELDICEGCAQIKQTMIFPFRKKQRRRPRKTRKA